MSLTKEMSKRCLTNVVSCDVSKELSQFCHNFVLKGKWKDSKLWYSSGAYLWVID